MKNIPEFTLNRVSSSKHGTFGVLSQWNEPFALTGEPPWKDNEVNISCIMVGKYICHRVDSPKFGITFEIMEVACRTKILFHKGNYPLKDTKGCVIIGEEFSMHEGKPVVASSSRGFREFLKRTSEFDEIYLTIKDTFK